MRADLLARWRLGDNNTGLRFGAGRGGTVIHLFEKPAPYSGKYLNVWSWCGKVAVTLAVAKQVFPRYEDRPICQLCLRSAKPTDGSY